MLKNLKNMIKERYRDDIVRLQYGRDIIKDWSIEYLKNKDNIKILDIGLGEGNDLLNIKASLNNSKNIEFYGVETYEPYLIKAREMGIEVFQVDIERERVPIDNNFFDIVIANQVLEHTKEWYFIIDEINRILKLNGILIIGVPNLASWHERLNLLFGRQPYNLDLLGPHIRGITHNNFISFIENGEGFKLIESKGSYIYGIFWSIKLNNLICKVFPKLCVSLFFKFKKIKNIDFIKNLDKKFLETNFYKG